MYIYCMYNAISRERSRLSITLVVFNNVTHRFPALRVEQDELHCSAKRQNLGKKNMGSEGGGGGRCTRFKSLCASPAILMQQPRSSLVVPEITNLEN